MNRGKLNKNNEESSLDRVNNFLARLMGKKNKQLNNSKMPKNNAPSDSKFVLIIVFVILVLWALTGLYYIPKDSIGIISYNGRVAKVVNGMEVGVTRPFPFSDMTIIDNDNTAFSIGKESDNQFTIVSSDDKNMRVIAEVDYSFKDPALYFQNLYQDDTDLASQLNWITQSYIQKHLNAYTESEITVASKLIIANEISSAMNQDLNKNGIAIVRLNLISLTSENNTIIESPTTSSFAESIIVEANNYAHDKAQQTKAMSADYYNLLAQYKANSKLVEDLLYYRMLSQIAESSNQESSYALLNISKADFLSLANNNVLPQTLTKNNNVQQGNNNPRALERDVVRERTFLDR